MRSFTPCLESLEERNVPSTVRASLTPLPVHGHIPVVVSDRLSPYFGRAGYLAGFWFRGPTAYDTVDLYPTPRAPEVVVNLPAVEITVLPGSF